MVDKTSNWSSKWNSSKRPGKQRKYRTNAPLHVKDRLVSSNLAPEMREELGVRSIPVRTGDRVKVMRGDQSGDEGIVSRVDREDERIYVNGIEIQRQDGTRRMKGFKPSNLQVVALNVEDERRLMKYDVADVEAIRVDEEEMEEALEKEEESEMMQKMQGGGKEDIKTEEEDDEETVEEESQEKEQETDYDEIVSGTISDAKDALKELDDADYNAALKAEKENKNRTTFTDWLESRVEE